MIKVLNIKKIKEKLIVCFTILVTSTAFFVMFLYSDECRKGISNGLVLCIKTLVPSLFMYMILASYISGSKAGIYMGAIFSKPIEKFLKLPKISASIILLSLVGGYPIGAKCIASAFDNKLLTKTQAKKLALFSVCSGPGFVLSFVSISLYNNKQIGIILLISQFISFFINVLIVAAVIKNEDYIYPEISHNINNCDFSKAVQQGCVATLNMCSMVIVFSSIISVLEKVLINHQFIKDILILFLEVTTACSKLYSKYPLYVISFAIGFSGICVHFQIFSILKKIEINKPLFFLFRIIQGITCACLTYTLLIFFPVKQEVFSTVNYSSVQFSSSVAGGLMLIFTSVCFLNSIHLSNLKRR